MTELIKTECERLNALDKCRVSYQLTPFRIPLNNSQKKIALRIIQEFLQNSLKHASCKNIAVSVQYVDSRLTIIASDDGIGFDTGVDYSGIGLENMRKRAELIGAQFSVSSALNKGTEISFLLETV